MHKLLFDLPFEMSQRVGCSQAPSQLGYAEMDEWCCCFITSCSTVNSPKKRVVRLRYASKRTWMSRITNSTTTSSRKMATSTTKISKVSCVIWRL